MCNCVTGCVCVLFLRCPVCICCLCGELVLSGGQRCFQLPLPSNPALHEGIPFPLCCYHPLHPSWNNRVSLFMPVWLALVLWAVNNQKNVITDHLHVCISRTLQCLEQRRDQRDATVSWPAERWRAGSQKRVQVHPGVSLKGEQKHPSCLQFYSLTQGWDFSILLHQKE